MSGLLGVGGGIVIVPLLVLAASFDSHRAHATSLAAIVPIAAVGALRFGLEGDVEIGTGLLLAAGSIAGAPLGARLMSRTKERTLKLLFAAIALAVAAQLFLAG